MGRDQLPEYIKNIDFPWNRPIVLKRAVIDDPKRLPDRPNDRTDTHPDDQTDANRDPRPNGHDPLLRDGNAGSGLSEADVAPAESDAVA